MKKLILMFMVVMATIFTISCGDSTTPIEDPTFLNAVKGSKYAEAGSEITFSADGKIMTMKDGVTAIALTFTFDGDPAHETQGLYKNDILPLYMPFLLKNGKGLHILDAASVGSGITDKNTIDWSGASTLLYNLP